VNEKYVKKKNDKLHEMLLIQQQDIDWSVLWYSICGSWGAVRGSWRSNMGHFLKKIGDNLLLKTQLLLNGTTSGKYTSIGGWLLIALLHFIIY